MQGKIKDIHIRVTEDEAEQIKKRAAEAKMSVSQFIISATLDKEVIIKEDFKPFLKQLSAIGNNLNQVTTLAHQGKIKCLELDSTKRELAMILKEITGSKIRIK